MSFLSRTDHIVSWHFVQVLDRATIGGAERHTWLLSAALARAGWPVTFIAPPGPLWDQIAAASDVPATLTCQQVPGLAQNPIAAARVLRGILTALPQRLVVHSHLTRTDATAAWVRRASSLPAVFVTTIHSQFRTDLPWRRAPLRRALYYPLVRWAWHHMDIVFAVSAATARQAQEHFGLTPSRVVPLQNAVDLRQLGTRIPLQEARRQLAMMPARPVVTSVGNLNRRKGQYVLLHAVARLPADVRPEVWLVGTGADDRMLRVLAERLGIGNLVRFFGRRDDVPIILSASDVYVQPSLTDALPRALLEAMALGIPSVASKVDGIPEIMSHEETGWFVPAGDSIALADRLLSVLRDPESAQAVAAAAARMVRTHCSMDGMAAAIVAEVTNRFGAAADERVDSTAAYTLPNSNH